MTVSDLIKLLQSYPKDMIVVTDTGLLEEKDLLIVQEYYNGDSANPQCEILNNVLKII